MAKNLTKRSEDYSTWYNELVVKADLAENSEIRGCMVIKPYGFAIWEKMQEKLDSMFKATGHVNAYFPIFIPKSYFSKEASHINSFAKECAIVTHYRLKNSEDGSGIVVDDEAKLEEELIIRPTSETIIWNTYRNWIQSYRDLPILVNQWANVVRWEMRTRPFLRTTEFLWQEGHTAHATQKDAEIEAQKIIEIYVDFLENFMAIPVIKGVKTKNERFSGALETLCIEALMQDGKALQAGTSHFLGQNFAKAFNVRFTTKDGKEEYVWATSWGVSTRLIGALIMVHSDDNGLVLPPNLAPFQVIIIPIYQGKKEFQKVSYKAIKIKKDLEKAGLSVKYDDRDTYKPGWKFNEYELKGIPIRITIGPKDIENRTIEVSRRDTLEKQFLNVNEILVDKIKGLLEDIQKNLFLKALKFREDNIYKVDNWENFKDVLEKRGGFIEAHWDGTSQTENKIKEETKATIRCIPFNAIEEEGKCVYSCKPSNRRVLFAKAY